MSIGGRFSKKRFMLVQGGRADSKSLMMLHVHAFCSDPLPRSISFASYFCLIMRHLWNSMLQGVCVIGRVPFFACF